jgi:uncharacterized membrane protein (DUF4010 family)
MSSHSSVFDRLREDGDMTDLASWQAVGVAAALGLLIGAERERSHPDSTIAGIRTFTLVAVLGSIVTFLPVWVGVALAATAGLLIVAGYALDKAREPGMTTEVALLATLGLGALARTESGLAVAIAVGMTALLVSKQALHHFVQQTVSDLERTDAVKFLVAAFIVLPLLPSENIGPYGVWDPQRLWTLVVVITGVGWLGYAATRLLGASRGLMVAGLAGGFVSGVATTGAMAAKARAGTRNEAALAGAVMASLSTLILLAVLLTVVDREVALNLMPGLVVGGIALLGEAFWLERRGRAEPHDSSEMEGRPFALLPALVLTAVISSVLLASRWLTDEFGSGATILATAAGGLADAHGTSVAAATLVADGTISQSIGVAAIAVALATNTIVKFIAALAGGVDFMVQLLWLLAPAITSVAIAAIF